MKKDLSPAYRNYITLDSTVRVRRQQGLAKALIWLAAALTMSVLIFIVGFIVINGFIATPVDASTSLQYGRELISAYDDGPGLVVAVNRKLNIRDITWMNLRDIYTAENRYWGYLSGQNLQVQPMIYAEDRIIFSALHYLRIDDQEAGANLMRKRDRQAVVDTLRSEKGGIAVIPAEWTEDLPGWVRILSIRDLGLAVNPDVTALHDGRRLDRLNASDENDVKLMDGSIKRWSELESGSGMFTDADNPEAPASQRPAVVPIRYSGLYRDYNYSDNAVDAGSAEEFAALIIETSGAVGVIPSNEAFENDINLMEIRRRQVKLNLRPAFLVEEPSRAGAVGGISTIIINTLVMIIFVLLIATPVGIGAAIYLTEYSKQGPILRIFRLGTETLAGIPSIIFGLFGLVFFSQFLGFKTGLISGSLTLTLMILPTIIRTSEEAIKSVPAGLKEGSMAMGATRLQTIFRIIIPTAAPGIITGVILGIGRAIGETAAILFTMGSNMALIKNLNSPVRVLSIHLYLLIRENISIENAFATATILVMIVFAVNFTTRKLIGRIGSAVK